MFGSNDKNQADSSQKSNDPTTTDAPAASVVQGSLVTPPPDPVITPTAPPLNDALSPAPAEPTLPPPPEMPTIVTNSSKAKDASDEPAPAPSVPLNTDDDELISIKQQA